MNEQIKKFQNDLEEKLYFSKEKEIRIIKPFKGCGSTSKIYEYIISRFYYEENYSIAIVTNCTPLKNHHFDNIIDKIFYDFEWENIKLTNKDCIQNLHNNNIISFYFDYIYSRSFSEVFLLDHIYSKNDISEDILSVLNNNSRLIVERNI